MYFLWCFQGTSCDVIGTKHALPVVGHGQLVTDPPSPHPCSSLVGLGLEGLPRRRIIGAGLGSDRTDSKGKDPALSGSPPCKHTPSVNSPGRELVKATVRDPHPYPPPCVCMPVSAWLCLMESGEPSVRGPLWRSVSNGRGPWPEGSVQPNGLGWLVVSGELEHSVVSDESECFGALTVGSEELECSDGVCQARRP